MVDFLWFVIEVFGRKNMKTKRWVRQLVMLAGILFVGAIVGVLDVKADNSQSQIGFTVEPIIPENQIDKEASYFHLSVEPDEQQEISVRIKSLEKEPVTIELGVNNAVTSSSGIIDYGKEKPILDESLKVPLTTMVTIPKENQKVTVKDFEEKIVKINIHTPKKTFPGIKLGALTFMKAEEKDNKKKAGIINRYGYKIGLILSEDRTTYNEGGDLKLKSIKPGLDNGQKAININFQNPEPKILPKLMIQAKMTKKDSKTVMKELKMTDRSMAPNSNFNFSVPWGMDPIKPGKYTMHIAAQSGDRKWKWDEDFTISESEANKTNKNSVNKYTITKNLRLLVIVVLILNAILFILRITNWNSKQEPEGLRTPGTKIVKKKKKRKQSSK